MSKVARPMCHHDWSLKLIPSNGAFSPKYNIPVHQNLAHSCYRAGLRVLEALTDTEEFQKQQEGRVRPGGTEQ